MMDRRWRYLLPTPVQKFPADLSLTVAITLATVLAVLLPVVRETPLRRILGLPFLLFFPGYALIALLFPKAGEEPVYENESGSEKNVGPDNTEKEQTGIADIQERGIDWVERLALSFGLSIAVIPLLGLAITFSPFNLNLVPVLLTVAGFTIVCATGAASRRWKLSSEKRFRVPYRRWVSSARKTIFDPENRIDAVLNVLLALSILLAVVTLVGAVLFPPDGERYTEFYILTENDDGELVASGYPETLTTNESAELVVGIENQEQETVEYTVVVQLQRVETGNNNTEILEREDIDQLQTTLQHNETWQQAHELEPDLIGEDLRLQYLLYRDEPPTQPHAENAYQDLHIWLDVEDADEQ